MELALNVTAKVMLTLRRGSIPLEAVVSHSPGTETPPPGPVPLSTPAFEMLLRSPAELQIKKKCSVVSLFNIEHPKHIRFRLGWNFPGNEAMLLELFVCFCFLLLYLCKCEKENCYVLALHDNAVFSPGLASGVLSRAGKFSCMFWLHSVNAQHPIPILQIYPRSVHLHTQESFQYMCEAYLALEVAASWGCAVKCHNIWSTRTKFTIMAQGGKNTHRMSVFRPGDRGGGDPKGIAAQR